MLVALTCRVDIVRDREERRDAIDQRWYPLLRDFGCDVLLIPNDVSAAAALVERAAPGGVLLSGGNDIPPYGESGAWAPERDAVERMLLEHAATRGLSVLGVCRGLQFLNIVLGGALSPLEGHAGTHHELHGPMTAKPERAGSYHRWGIMPADLASPLRATAFAPDGSVEAVEHRTLRGWRGVMWHPEREAEGRADAVRLLTSTFTTG